MLAILKRIYQYLNPIGHLGDTSYSYIFPLITTSLAALILQITAATFFTHQSDVGVYAIVLFIALIIYFAFREGLVGGFTATAITILYYLYLVYALHYHGEQFISGIETIVILGILYGLLAGIIGWLKQAIDKHVEGAFDDRKRLQAIIEQLPVGVLITDDKGRLVQGNKKLNTILGIRIPVGFYLGKDTSEDVLINENPIIPSKVPILRVLATGRSVVKREFTFIRNDKKRLFLEVSSSPIKNRTGKLVAAASIISDVTSQKELEVRKDDFVNMASHELKTPITSMKLYVDSLIMQVNKYDERTRRIFKSMKTQTDKLEDLVEDLLDVSRIQTGKLRFQNERFRLDVLAQEALADLKDISRQSLVIAKTAPTVIYGDRFRIYQVFTNLLTNAMKYSPGDKPITVTIRKDNTSVIVGVQDFGIGIPKDQQKKIFERLHQASTLPGKTFPGLGMGLYISREIIRRHKGKIWVESELGRGSTFYLSLPRSETSIK